MSTVMKDRQPHEPRITSNGDPIIFAEGKIGAIVQYPVLVDEGSGYVARTFEKFVRAPGTRIIALSKGGIYLQAEARIELKNSTDWRLPGGKVIDSFTEYKNYLNKEIPENIIIEAAAKELKEEAHLTANTFSIFAKKECGATVEWDLYYVIAENATENQEKIEHNEGEDIQDSGWFTPGQIIEKCKRGEIGEGRTVGALLEFIYKK